jgi:hypothetical protein
MPWFVRLPDMQQPDKMKYTLKAAPRHQCNRTKEPKVGESKANPRRS